MKKLSSNVSELAGQMIMVGIRAHEAISAQKFFEANEGYDIGGIILYDENISSSPTKPHNIRSPKQLKDLTLALQSFNETSLFIAVDQEGGKVNRLKYEYGFSQSLSWENIGKINDFSITKKESQNIAQTLKNSGINVNFAPVLDLLISKDNIITMKERALSSDPNKVAEHAKIFIDAHTNNNILAVAKHFPGQGSSIGDTHTGWTDVSDSWNKNELKPYQKLIDSKSVNAIMTSHLYNSNLDNHYPATLSKKILTELLRNNLNFKGLIISDDPQMKALTLRYKLDEIIEQMIHAGVDVFCFGNNLIYDPEIVKKIHKIIYNLLKNNKISESRLRESYERIIKVKSSLGLL